MSFEARVRRLLGTVSASSPSPSLRITTNTVLCKPCQRLLSTARRTKHLDRWGVLHSDVESSSKALRIACPICVRIWASVGKTGRSSLAMLQYWISKAWIDEDLMIISSFFFEEDYENWITLRLRPMTSKSVAITTRLLNPISLTVS